MRDKKLLTVQEACQYLGISRATLLKTEEEGLLLPIRTVGGHRRYSRETLDQYIRATTGLQSPPQSLLRDRRSPVVLPRIVERLASSPAPADQLMKEVIQDLLKLLQADAGFIALLDERNLLRLRVGVGLSLPRKSQTTPIPLEETCSGRALRLQQPVVYDNSGSDLPTEGLTQGICAPLAYRGVPLGVIHVLSFSRHQFLPTEVQFLSLIALYLASLIVNSQLLADSKQREKELSCLNRLSETMQVQHDLTSMAKTLLSETLRITGADGGTVFLYENSGGLRIVATHGHTAGLSIQMADRLTSAVARALQEDEPYLLLTASHDAALDARLQPLLGPTGSAVLFPLRSQGETLGVLHLYASTHRDASQWRAPFLATLCAHATLILQRAALCDRLAVVSQNEYTLRRYYEKMVEASPVAMEIIDGNCRIIGWNEAAERITGISREEAIGADKFRLQPGLLKYNGREILATVFETRETYRLSKFPYERRDGTIIHMDLTFLPFTDENNVSAIIVFAQESDLATPIPSAE